MGRRTASPSLARHVSHTPAACSFPGENARCWEALGEARPGQSSLWAGALRYRAWAQSWSSAALAARSVLPRNRPAHPRASSAKTRGFHTQLDEGPETP